MKTLIVFVLLAAAPALADPLTAKLGKQKVTLTTCTIDGPALYLGNVASGVVVAPDGALLVLDGDGGVHRYTVATGADCRLTPDKTFGKDGVIATKITAKGDDVASLAMDRAGTIYAWGDHGTARIAGGKVGRMCGEGSIAASPRSDFVWTWTALENVYRTAQQCEKGDRIDLSRGGEHSLGWMWALDDRIVAEIGRGDVEILDGHGAFVRKLSGSDPYDVLPRAWDACGKGVCAAGEYAFYAWGADGKLLGKFDTQPLSQTDHSWNPHGFATSGTAGWLLGDEYMDGAPAHPAILFRVDGLPR
jgi:hypothetical protein